jgi:RES domain-containing protein
MAITLYRVCRRMSRQDYPTGQSGESAVLRGPSAVVTSDWNYLVNPQHLKFAQISIEPPESFKFDERVFEGK